MFSRKHIDTNVIMIYLYQVYKKLQNACLSLPQSMPQTQPLCCCTKTAPFFGVFPMFVPSLFW